MTRDQLADEFDAILRRRERPGVAELAALLLARVDEYAAALTARPAAAAPPRKRRA